jgi:hypothetical protein
MPRLNANSTASLSQSINSSDNYSEEDGNDDDSECNWNSYEELILLTWCVITLRGCENLRLLYGCWNACVWERMRVGTHAYGNACV